MVLSIYLQILGFFFLTADYCSTVYVPHFHICSLIEGHGGSFHFLAGLSSVAVNMAEQVCVNVAEQVCVK